MEFSSASATHAASSPTPSPSPTSPSSPASLSVVMNAAPHVIIPCAACKILRRRCVDKCVLAPYFPPTEPVKFITAHRVFGASNIIKLLQDLPEPQRADAVSSMVYEAGARIRDPVYGCAGTICQLQKQVTDLQAQLAKSQANLLNARAQQANLMALLCVKVANYPPSTPPQLLDNSFFTDMEDDDVFSSTGLGFLDDGGLTSGPPHMIWEPLST